MDTVFGITYDGGVIVAADQENARSIMVYQHHLDKVAELSSHTLLGCSGPNSDFVRYTEYCEKNMTLYELNNDNQRLSVKAQANFCRGEMARALRKGPYQVNCVLGGYDEGVGAQLYFMDYMASLQKVNFGSQGYASNFCLSIFDREWRPNLTQAEALEVIEHCIGELKQRFLISQPNFMIKAVDKDGIKILKCGAKPADHQ
jgi:20S proteasome subunit beta 4